MEPKTETEEIRTADPVIGVGVDHTKPDTICFFTCDGTIHFIPYESAKHLHKALGALLDSMDPHKPTLQDVFMRHSLVS